MITIIVFSIAFGFVVGWTCNEFWMAKQEINRKEAEYQRECLKQETKRELLAELRKEANK